MSVGSVGVRSADAKVPAEAGKRENRSARECGGIIFPVARAANANTEVEIAEVVVAVVRARDEKIAGREIEFVGGLGFQRGDGLR